MSIGDEGESEVQLQAAYSEWSSGNQVAAINRLIPFADSGMPWAVAMVAWFYMQQGTPGFDPGIRFAEQAGILGMPWIAAQFALNTIANVSSVPHLTDRASALYLRAAPVQGPSDPISAAWNLMGQGQFRLALKLLGTTGVFPKDQGTWETLLEQSRAQIAGISALGNEAASTNDEFKSFVTSTRDAITNQKNELETSAKQASLLVSGINAVSVQQLFDDQAKRNSEESRSAWWFGVRILIGAAILAVLPILLHYIGEGPKYSPRELLVAHAGATAALAALAGVVLARARNRDSAAQRATDLSTAMGTMISYSNQIKDPGEREQFLLTMGQVVFQSHLDGGTRNRRTESSGSSNFASALRGA